MATHVPAGHDPSLDVKIRERLWSEEVAIAEAGSDPLRPKNIAYEFSNGRRFVEAENPYIDPTP